MPSSIRSKRGVGEVVVVVVVKKEEGGYAMFQVGVCFKEDRSVGTKG